jgi:hypothetical protein
MQFLLYDECFVAVMLRDAPIIGIGQSSAHSTDNWYKLVDSWPTVLFCSDFFCSMLDCNCTRHYAFNPENSHTVIVNFKCNRTMRNCSATV